VSGVSSEENRLVMERIRGKGIGLKPGVKESGSDGR